MANAKKRQQALRHQRAVVRRATKSKAGPSSRRASMPAGVRTLLRASAGWPVLSVQVSRGWEKSTELTQIVVARQGTGPTVAVGAFLIDLGCLGVKNALTHIFASEQELDDRLLGPIRETQRLERCSLDLAAKIIQTAIDYGRRNGFEPHPDFAEASVVLAGANPDACRTRIPVGGPGGKPFFVPGPYDNLPRILAKLERTLGPGNFECVVPMDMLSLDELDEDDDSDEDDEDGSWEDDDGEEPRRLTA